MLTCLGAFAQGQVSRDKVDSIVPLARPESQSTLLRLAQSWGGERVRRVSNANLRVRAAEAKRPLDPDEDPRKLRWRHLAGGLARVSADLFYEDAALVKAMIEEGVKRAEHEAPRQPDDPNDLHDAHHPKGDWDAEASTESNAGRTRPRIRNHDGLVHAAGEYLGWAANGREARHPGRYEVQVIVQPERRGGGSEAGVEGCLLYTSPSPRDLSTSRMPSSA